MNNQTITKVAVVSDTHSHLDPRIADIVRECDIAVHGGDICGENILESMQPKSGKIIVVTDNNDPYCHLTGSELSEVLSFDVAGETITVEHGHTHGAHKPSQMKIRLKSKCLVIQKNRKEASKKDREDQLFAGLILFRNWL